MSRTGQILSISNFRRPAVILFAVCSTHFGWNKEHDLEVSILCLSKRGNTVRFSHDRSSSMRVQSLLRSCLTGVHSRQLDPLFAVTGIFKGKMTQQETGKTSVSFFAVSLHLVKISN